MPSEDSKLVLVVDDEPRMINFIRMNLELEGYRVISATDGLDAVRKAREMLPDLVLLDIMMPEMDGYETLQAIREESTVPVIMLTAKSEESDKVKGLDLGADDYITKPFSPRELVSRVKAVIRRAELPAQVDKAPIVIDDRLSIDFNRREVIVEGKPVKLRPTEWRLLYHLVQNAGWVVPHETLLSKVWGWEYRDETQYLRLYITYLRQKIEPDPAHPRYIFTERGMGYRFVDYKGAAGAASKSAGAS
ncbi:MAG: response regulator transcription factor [Anaerolineae bacterium]|nr:response regulator transcription factor [Thermoflexales bacterium]MDW8406892.1 response regulator transcription factor [Anaerolineae bacterium]